jgi:phosphatidylethanolamine/phosphatidyl-N-methylethanolamine N-methyltransferase
MTTGLRQLGSFFKAIITNPRKMGTVWPSSKRLAKAMAAHIPLSSTGWVIELGAGTGPITGALIARGVDPKRIIVIEYQAYFVDKLRELFPEIKVIKGDAANLISFLSDVNSKPVDAVVSSLPLISLPRNTTDKILHQINQLLLNGGRYIQYTYSYKEMRFDILKNYRKIVSKRIWLNIPPARVDVFEVSSSSKRA